MLLSITILTVMLCVELFDYAASHYNTYGNVMYDTIYAAIHYNTYSNVMCGTV